MKLSPQQDETAKKVSEWLSNGDEQVFRLFGYAGTGKTTLAKILAEGVDGDVLFGAYTGKAAHVLKTKGCHNAATIHSMIYHSRDKSKNRLITLKDELAQFRNKMLSEEGVDEEFLRNHPIVKKLQYEIEQEEDQSEKPMFILNRDSVVKDADLVVIDECSMVDERMGEDLLSFGTPILVLGDPAQLPPVGGAGYFTENVKPDIMLTEIHRQAGESPIIRMATDVRNQRNLEVGDWGDGCQVLPPGSRLSNERKLAFDQILVGKNKTRHLMNNAIRKMKGYQYLLPSLGDRLVCLRNDHELGILNGAIFEVTDVDEEFDRKIVMSVKPEDDILSIDVTAHTHHFTGNEKDLKWYEKKEAQEFGYGYALTCHKSQGSQWKDVCVFDEGRSFRESRYRWLYTAITRASETVTVINT